MGSSMELGLMEELVQIVSFTELDSSNKAQATFQWGGTIAALFLLLLHRTGQRSRVQTNLLVLYLFASFPTMLFKILRGEFGHWVAFLAVGANLFFPKNFPVARFILFVITPDWLANGLRDGIAAGVYCLLIGVLLIITKIRGFPWAFFAVTNAQFKKVSSSTFLLNSLPNIFIYLFVLPGWKMMPPPVE